MPHNRNVLAGEQQEEARPTETVGTRVRRIEDYIHAPLAARSPSKRREALVALAALHAEVERLRHTLTLIGFNKDVANSGTATALARKALAALPEVPGV